MVETYNREGVEGLLKRSFKDLFAHRTLKGWSYLLGLSLMPVVIELIANKGSIVDYMGLFGSITGILTVILVSEGRASNYLFGLINSIFYLILTMQNGFYGEVLTTLYFTVMQPIGLLTWLSASREKKVEQTFVAKRLDFKGWVKYLAITAIWWGIFGFIYQSIGSKRPFRDSITDGTNGVGQLLMNGAYLEQWVFWSATNIFSIYLWWGSNIQMQGMYWVYLINCLVGAYNWYKQTKA